MAKRWNVEYDVQAHKTMWLIFKFKSADDYEKVLHGGPYIALGCFLYLKHSLKEFFFQREELHCLMVSHWVFAISFVYEQLSLVEQKTLWEAFQNIAIDMECPCLVLGDFNTFLSIEDVVHITARVTAAQQRLIEVQEVGLSLGALPDNYIELHHSTTHLNAVEHSFCMQHAKLGHFKQVDLNSSYFHVLVKQTNKRNEVTVVKVSWPVQAKQDTLWIKWVHHTYLKHIDAFLEVLGIALMCFLSKRNDKESNSSAYSSFGSVLKYVISPLLDKQMLLIIPLIVYSGLQQAFVWAEFTNKVVTPALGISGVGGAMAIYGAADAICSLVAGKLTSGFYSITLLMYGGASLHIIVILWLLLGYSLTSGVVGYIYPLLMSIFWGVGNGVFNTQLSALLGILYKHEKV
ncbi:hypothetical protein ZIOFF_003671 [Zingiber officinale]|uniref:Uncharacterized protein n=1 Tax=Zingiber officinale TaxID=94328 RepID=A0A8J5MAD4_ZINOF|nr:hypothetical protein ZIOFF_003671 [Zingiber officinale]